MGWTMLTRSQQRRRARADTLVPMVLIHMADGNYGEARHCLMRVSLERSLAYGAACAFAEAFNQLAPGERGVGTRRALLSSSRPGGDPDRTEVYTAAAAFVAAYGNEDHDGCLKVWDQLPPGLAVWMSWTIAEWAIALSPARPV